MFFLSYFPWGWNKCDSIFTQNMAEIQLKKQRNKIAFEYKWVSQNKTRIWIYRKSTFHHCSLHSKQSLFTSGNTLSPETEEMKSDHERMGVAPGGWRVRRRGMDVLKLSVCFWGGVELTEATSRDSSLSIKALRRRGRVCQGFPVPTEHPHAAPPTLNTFSQSCKSLLHCHEPPDSLAMHDQSPSQASKHQQSLALGTWQTCPGASFPPSLQTVELYVSQRVVCVCVCDHTWMWAASDKTDSQELQPSHGRYGNSLQLVSPLSHEKMLIHRPWVCPFMHPSSMHPSIHPPIHASIHPLSCAVPQWCTQWSWLHSH